MAIKKQHIDLFITRYLSGELNPDEMAMLDDWRHESSDNERYFNQYVFINEKTRLIRSEKKFNTEKAWQSVHQKMQQSPEPKIIKSDNKFIYNKPIFLSIAAVILLLIGIASFFTLYTQSKPQFITYISNDSIKTMTLADNSTICLNKNSKILYDKDFGKENRKIKLEGEAFFEVKHSQEKPFIVETQGTYIEDIGTSFNIKSKIENELVEVYVENGEVKFYTDKKIGISLIKGEKGVYNKITGCFSKIKETDTNLMSYKTRRFVFSNTPLDEVVQILSDAYDVNILLENNQLSQYKINVSFDNENIEAILTIIAATIDGEIEKKSDSYIINK